MQTSYWQPAVTNLDSDLSLLSDDDGRLSHVSPVERIVCRDGTRVLYFQKYSAKKMMINVS